jgi:hypothetical protein
MKKLYYALSFEKVFIFHKPKPIIWNPFSTQPKTLLEATEPSPPSSSSFSPLFAFLTIYFFW